jgi:UDP-3-O-[3-hydroxymyristoyl] glucosamine N-acyltransferase
MNVPWKNTTMVWDSGQRALYRLHYTSNAVIGADGFGFRPCPERGLVKIPQIGNVIIEIMSKLPTLVDRGKFSSTVLGDGCKIDNLVQIGHNKKLSRFALWQDMD